MKKCLLESRNDANSLRYVESYDVDLASAAALPEKRCYTVEELADILTCSRETVYQLLRKNEFRWFRIGGRGGSYRISKKSFDSWLDSHIMGNKQVVHTEMQPDQIMNKDVLLKLLQNPETAALLKMLAQAL